MTWEGRHYCHVLEHVYDVCDVSFRGRRYLYDRENICNIIDLLEFLNHHPNQYNWKYSRYVYLRRLTGDVIDEDEDYDLETFFYWLADYTKYRTIHPLEIIDALSQQDRYKTRVVTMALPTQMGKNTTVRSYAPWCTCTMHTRKKAEVRRRQRTILQYVIIGSVLKESSGSLEGVRFLRTYDTTYK